ncbi:hypothetical protein LTT66_18085 [Nocardia gipuzkoensis]|uniref:hypothetical protein n=1 Tax=Nocardia gipuzkoensis TaxID=2749991 RepID=UPI001E45851D|nr:hypothetical protein [Nocardia gipuzkoensis]UGT65280.1 hypothetical protein LTT66_18085 [Nocardia gipuzkoensis]
MSSWTDSERDLLRNVHHYLGQVLANPAGGIEHLRGGHGSGGGAGFTYEFGSTAIRGQWREWIPEQWRPDGRPRRWRSGALLLVATVSYTRLEAWAEAQPAGLRAKALTYWQTYPEYTRDLPALDRVTLAAIEGRPARRRGKSIAIPTSEQYALFGSVSPIEGGAA